MTLRPSARLIAFLLAISDFAAELPKAGMPERIKVHGKSLEGNLEGDSPDRDVSIYLPPSYKTAKKRRYPVVYMLHGFTDSDEKWFWNKAHWINLPAVIDRALNAGTSKEVIVVMPDALTRYGGSMYSSSAATGDWESYVARELVAYVDSHYRTIPNGASRGLAGHSMGGYGTLRIGMKNPDTFSSIYLLSPCCLTPPDSQQPRGPLKAESIKSFEEVASADFFTKAMLASAAAWSPDPKNAPMFLALPTREGKTQPDVLAKWAANAPLAMVDQYIGNLKRLKAISMDAGTKDAGIAASIRALDAILSGYQIAHGFEIYEGDHVNRVAERIETKALPFFTSNLAFETPKR